MVSSPFLAESIQSKEEVKSLTQVRDAYKAEENEILDILISSGALLKGHFKLESGQHSVVFLRFSNVAGSRANVERIADLLLAQLRKDGVKIDAVLTQEAAGRVLAGTIADKLGKKRIIVVEADDKNRPTKNLMNETSLYPADRVLVVSDLTTTGHGLRIMTTLVREKKAIPVAVALFATRNKKEVRKFEQEDGIKVYALADLAFEDRTYATKAECSVCAGEKVPIIDSWET